MCISALVYKYIRCYVILEVLKALVLRIQVFWAAAVTGSFIPDGGGGGGGGGGMILQGVRNQ